MNTTAEGGTPSDVPCSAIPSGVPAPEGVVNTIAEGPTPSDVPCSAIPSGVPAPEGVVTTTAEGGTPDRLLVASGAPWEAVVGYSRAVRVGQWVAVAGTTAAAEGGGAVGGDDIGAQTREALRRIEVALQQAGARLDHVVRTRIFVTDIGRWEAVGRVHGEVFANIRPASTIVEIGGLIDPALLVEIEADAVVA